MVENLDKLLDNDVLSPEQEREIRRLVSYELYIGDDDLLYMSYYFKHNPLGTHIYSFYEHQLARGNQVNKDAVYKHIMFHLIINGEDDSRKLKKEIYKLFLKEDIYFNTLRPLKSKSQDLYNMWKRIGKSRGVLVA